MRRIVSVTLLVGVGLAVSTGCAAPHSESSQSVEAPERGAVLWRGFRHGWSYNHRLNRLGDYVTLECGPSSSGDVPGRRCRGAAVHTAASGTGADTATFQSHHSRIVSKHAGFQTGRVQLRIDGREERDLRAEHDGTIEAIGRLRDRDHYAVLLNGFDVYAAGKRAKAKKVQRFRIWTRGEGDYDAAADAVEYEVGAVLNMNCDSVECKQQANRVRYTVDLRFLVVGYDDAVRRTTKPFEVAYSWTKREELSRSDLRFYRKRQWIDGAKEGYGEAALGFREIDFTLGKKGRSKDHWFVDWEHALRDVEYDAESGRATFDLGLFFKEWNRRAKKKLTSIARKGDAALRTDLVLLQFREARVERHSVSGRIEWKGRNRPADSDAARWQKRFEMSF